MKLFSITIAACVLVISTLQAATLSTHDEHIVWRRSPITIVLPVNQERLITFPSEVQFGYDKGRLPPTVLRVQNDDQTLYLTAYKPFTTERVEAKLADGAIILLDISAQANGDDNPIDIVKPKPIGTNTGTNSNTVNTASVTYTTLTRYGLHQLYAPKRLLTNPLGITRFPMATPHLIPLFYDASAIAAPLASWRANDLYVTPILVKNQLHEWLTINPNHLCGNFIAPSY